jgi:hypothetical protein
MKSKVVLPSVGLINFVIEITMVPNTKYVRILLGRDVCDEIQVLLVQVENGDKQF